MSTTSPILLLSRSTMTRPRHPRAVSMLGVAMLDSFLVGYLNRALPALSRSRAITCTLLLLGHREPRRAPLPPRYAPRMARSSERVRSSVGCDISVPPNGRSLAGAPPGQTVLQQPDNFLSSMTIAFMVLDEVDAAI